MSKNGFAMFEVLAAISVFMVFAAGAMIPVATKQILLRAANVTAQEIVSIQEAERNYYIKQMNVNNGAGSWCADVATLQSTGFLPSGGPAGWPNNPWNNPYMITDNGTYITVSTSMPSDLFGTIQFRCQQATDQTGTNGYDTVSSSIPVPAQEPALAGLVHRYSNTGNPVQDASNVTATQTIGVGVGQNFIVSGNVSGAGLNPQYTIPQIDQTSGSGQGRQGDIYVDRLAQKGLSSSGWLSDAQFPANINTRTLVLDCTPGGMSTGLGTAYGNFIVYVPADFTINSVTYINENGGGMYTAAEYNSDIPAMREFAGGVGLGATSMTVNASYNGENTSFTLTATPVYAPVGGYYFGVRVNLSNTAVQCTCPTGWPWGGIVKNKNTVLFYYSGTFKSGDGMSGSQIYIAL